MERVECVGKPVLADVFLLGREILAVAVHVRQRLHVVVLEHVVELAQVRPALLVEPAVADAGHDEHAVIGEHALVPYDLRGERLHHLDRVGAHAVAVVEVRRHAEDDDVVFLLRPVDVGALVRRLPADGLHLLRPAAVDLDLPALRVEHSVAAEELLAHLLFHQHALAVKLVAHQAVGGNGHEVRPVHDLRHVMRADAAPVADARRAVLVAAGVAAVGVALRVADEHGDVRVIDVFVHDDVVALVSVADVHQVLVVLAVVAGDLAGVVELAEQLLAQNRLHLLHGRARMQAVGKKQQHVLLLNARAVQLVKARPDGDLAVARRLVAALDDVRDDDDDRAPLVRQLTKRLHADRMADALEGRRVEAVPVLRQAFGIGHRLAGDKDVGAVRQVGTHQAIAVFKIKLHNVLLLLRSLCQ